MITALLIIIFICTFGTLLEVYAEQPRTLARTTIVYLGTAALWALAFLALWMFWDAALPS